MALLSALVCNVIVEYPLKDVLNIMFQDSLLKVAKLTRLDSSLDSETESLRRDMIKSLLQTLIETEAAMQLPSRAAGQCLGSDITFVRLKFMKEQLHPSVFDNLSQLIINNASDFDIWATIFDLIDSATPVTPLRSIAPTRDSTRNTRSSASLARSQENRAIIEEELFYEIRKWTFRKVDGFLDTHFKKRDIVIFEAIKARHECGR